MSQRGFTLIEILISMGISLVGIAAALSVLAAQNASFSRQSGLGSAVSQSQGALDALENAVRMAGTGIDPQMAFDFDFYKCVLPGGALAMTDSGQCSTATRDSATQPDDLVVAYRDMRYATNAPADARVGCNAGNASTFVGRVWGVTAATNSSVSLVLKPGDVLYPGQVLQIVCNDATSYTYATVSAKVSVASTAAACSTTSVSLYTAGIDVHDPFNQPSLLAATCFSNGGAASARAFAVVRNRFFVRRDGSNAAQPHTYLMLDQGLDLNLPAGLGDEDLIPIASDVLDLQVAYVTEQPGIMALPTRPNGFDTAQTTYVVDSDKNGIWGDTAGVAEQLTEPVYAGAGNSPTAQFNAANAALYSSLPQACSGYATACLGSNCPYQYPCLWGIAPVETSKASTIQAYRWTAWPGNISNVLIGLMTVGPVIEESTAQTTDEQNMTALLNRGPLTSPAYNAWYSSVRPSGRKRVVIRSGIRPTNMALASLFWN